MRKRCPRPWSACLVTPRKDAKLDDSPWGLLGQVAEMKHCVVEVRERQVETEDETVRVRFLGSPTVLVDGRDVEARRNSARQLRSSLPPLSGGWETGRSSLGGMD